MNAAIFWQIWINMGSHFFLTHGSILSIFFSKFLRRIGTNFQQIMHFPLKKNVKKVKILGTIISFGRKFDQKSGQLVYHFVTFSNKKVYVFVYYQYLVARPRQSKFEYSPQDYEDMWLSTTWYQTAYLFSCFTLKPFCNNDHFNVPSSIHLMRSHALTE